MMNRLGTWEIVQGIAEVNLEDERLTARLAFSSPQHNNQLIEGTVSLSSIDAVVRPDGSQSFQPYTVFGGLTVSSSEQGIAQTIFLTDGSTIIGLAHGAPAAGQPGAQPPA